ncbi:chaperonin 10-like protein [Aspergillus undulatus]|uniref:chaperonin 10-like protein n=1 Tax=Aspergillus undulatus TaxID=1810928 RepID=UPI003CCDABD0
MRAAQFHAAGDIRIEDIPPPQPDSSDTKDKILIEVEWCGICGSDLNEYLHGLNQGPFAIPTPETGPHPLTNALLPLPIGHEFSGRIKHVPESIPVSKSSTRTLRKGQAVVVDPRYFCSSCSPCTQAATSNCDKLAFMGISGKWGGLSEVVAAAPEQVYVLPENPGGEGEEVDLDLAAAALIEPLAVAWHAVKLYLSIAHCQYQSSHLNSNEPVAVDIASVPILVVGAGPVGVATVFVLRARGAKTIFVSETSKARRDMLLETGIPTEIFDPTTDDVPERIKALTGDGVSIVFDCAGAQAGFQAGCASLRYRGVYINLALPKGPITLPIMPFLWNEIMYKCSLAYDEVDFQETVDAFVSG